MFQQFRSRYPAGSLTSELLQIHEGTYIVRVSLQNEGLILVTALAGAETVEKAEDRARERALEVLNLIPLSPVKTEIESTENPKVSGSKLELPTIPQSNLPIPSEISYPPVVPAVQTPTQSQLTDIPLPTSPKLKVPTPETLNYQPTRDVSNTDLAPMIPIEMTPIDLSDVIAQTTVEIKRLRWTEEQGREYLKQHYGKRSRQHLTDEELVDFLHYLQQQPSP